MRKKLFWIFPVLLMMLAVFTAIIFRQGYLRYKKEVEDLPLDEAVRFYTETDNYVPYDQIDQDFINAVISVEDKRFFDREGYDLVAWCRAMYHNFKAKGFVEGGSTITEQIAKKGFRFAHFHKGGYFPDDIGVVSKKLNIIAHGADLPDPAVLRICDLRRHAEGKRNQHLL